MIIFFLLRTALTDDVCECFNITFRTFKNSFKSFNIRASESFSSASVTQINTSLKFLLSV